MAAAIFENEARLDAEALGVVQKWEDQRGDIRDLYLSDAEAALDALAAAGFDLSGGWRPIDTAPREPGFTCLLYFPDENAVRVGALEEDGASARDGAGRATHWRPLPDPPHAAPGGQVGE